MKNTSTLRLVTTAIMGAIAFVLMAFAFPIIPAVPFLKVDFSDLAVALATFLFGPVVGTLTTLIRVILHYFQTGGDMGYPVGEIASFFASLAFIFPIYYGTRKTTHLPAKQAFVKRVFAYLYGTIGLTIVMTILNFVLLLPFYLAVMGLKITDFGVANINQYILYAVIPFNLLKGVLVSIGIELIVQRVYPRLLKRFNLS